MNESYIPPIGEEAGYKFSESGSEGVNNGLQCKQKTRDELRQLHTESLGISPDSSWEEIDKLTDENLKEGEIPDTSCFFDLDSGENECYSVPSIENSCLNQELN